MHHRPAPPFYGYGTRYFGYLGSADRLYHAAGHATGTTPCRRVPDCFRSSRKPRVNRADLRELTDIYFARLEGRLDAGFADLEGRLNTGLAGVNGRLDTSIAGLRAEVASQMRDQMKWMFVFWMGPLVPLAGLIVALGKDWL